MNMESEMNNFHLVDRLQNKLKMNTLYGALCSPFSITTPDEIEKVKSQLNAEIQIHRTFFKSFNNQKN